MEETPIGGNPNCRTSILKKMEVAGRRKRSYTRRSKRPSSWTAQPPPIPTLPTIVTGSVCVSDVIKSMKKKWTLKQFPKTLFFGLNEKCPLSVLAKPSKSRISRLAVISSFSQKMGDARGEVKPLSKLSSTPNPKVKQVAAKYLTTPRNKNCLPSPNSFRSVQNLKPTNSAKPKNRTVAKALVFQSLKKVISIKTSSELRTPLTKICEGMKRLEITSQRKRILGYSNKSSKDIRCDSDKSLPLNPSRRKVSAYKDKSKAKELFRPPNYKEKGNKSLRCIEKGNKPCNSMPKETVENDLSSMEIDLKSRDGSVLCSSRITEGNACEEWLSTEKTSGNLDTINSTREEAVTCLEVVPLTKNSDMVLLDASRGEMSTSSNSEEGSLEENDFPKFEENSKGGNESSEGIDKEGKNKSKFEEERKPRRPQHRI